MRHHEDFEDLIFRDLIENDEDVIYSRTVNRTANNNNSNSNLFIENHPAADNYNLDNLDNIDNLDNLDNLDNIIEFEAMLPEVPLSDEELSNEEFRLNDDDPSEYTNSIHSSQENDEESGDI